jgi:intergrase/recombinase
MDIVNMFSGLNMSQKRHLTNGVRNLFNFYQAQGLVGKQYLDMLRDNFPKTSIGVDLNVPTESDVLTALRHLEERDKNRRIFALYNLLIDSGLRLVESISSTL